MAIVVGAVLLVAAAVIGLIRLNDRLTCGDPPHYGCGPGGHSPSGNYSGCIPC